MIQIFCDVCGESRKFRSGINKAFPNLTKIELFARGNKEKDLYGDNKFDGWDVWGNEC